MYRCSVLLSLTFIHIQVDDMIADDNKVVSRITARGTHKGQFMNIPPTPKKHDFKRQ